MAFTTKEAEFRKAIQFFHAHSHWLNENWSLTPEGREYKEKFDNNIKIIEREHSKLKAKIIKYKTGKSK